MLPSRLQPAYKKPAKGRPTDWAALSALQPHVSAEKWQGLSRYPTVIEICASRDLGVIADQPIDSQGMFLSVEATTWLKLSNLGFAFTMEKHGHGQIEIDYNGSLFAAVAMQLCLTICRSEGPHICSACGDPYFRVAKGVKDGNMNFCSKCGKDAALGKADERRREKIRAARDLHSRGISVPEIIRQLNVRNTVRSSAKDTVRRWIEKGH